MSQYVIVCALSLVLYLVFQVSPRARQQTQGLAPPLPTVEHPVDLPGLHHIVAFTDRLYSGAVPSGELGFVTLKAMGIKTIISVDGAKPELAYAQKYGLRYIHLPIGYDAVPRDRQLQIARIVRDLPGLFYIHCHHGKHRSASVAATITVTLGFLNSRQAIKRMRVSGTSLHYKGLFASVLDAVPASKSQLDSTPDTFPQVWQTRNLVDAMVAIDQAKDHLKAIQSAGWQPPIHSPDLVPISEAAKLADLLKNLKDDKQVTQMPREMTNWLLNASSQATALETQLMVKTRQLRELDEQFNLALRSCTHCHEKYRN